VACLVVLTLTFLLGMLVGRQWARSTMPLAPATVEGGRAIADRRSGDRPRRLGEHEPDDATPRMQEKLTFYQTLTAPLAVGPPPAPKPKSVPTSAGASARDAGPRAGAGPGAAAGASYTVQVAAFKTRPQADALREKLGKDAYVVQVEGPSSARYRVRVGTFGSRADGEAAAARLRAEHSLPAYVTKR
jgi:cell division protein FtsN